MVACMSANSNRFGCRRQDILRFEMSRDHDMIGRPQRVEPGGFSRAAEVDHEFRGCERSEVGDADAYFHEVPSAVNT